MVSTRTKVLTVRVPNEIAEDIRRLAERRGESQSQTMVMMLTEWLLSRRYSKPEDDK